MTVTNGRRSLPSRRRYAAGARSAVAAAARSTPFSAVVSSLERLERAGGSVLPVLMYHRVADPRTTPRLDPALVSATPQAFEEQIRVIASTRRAVSLDQLLDTRRGGARLPERPVLVTFDDAYRDFAEHAWPVLRRHGMPVTLFVPTGYPDHPERAFWWDRIHAAVASVPDGEELETPVGRVALRTVSDRVNAVGRLRLHAARVPHEEALAAVAELERAAGSRPQTGAVLTWEELRGLAAEGVTIAPHSQTHPLLDRIALDRAEAEIEGSVADVARELGHMPRAFAYPGGGISDGVKAAIARAGVELAFTTLRGKNDLRRCDWLALRRINVGLRSSPSLLRAQLLSLPRLTPTAAGGRGGGAETPT